MMIKQEPGAEPEKVIVTAIVPSEEPTYCHITSLKMKIDWTV